MIPEMDEMHTIIVNNNTIKRSWSVTFGSRMSNSNVLFLKTLRGREDSNHNYIDPWSSQLFSFDNLYIYAREMSGKLVIFISNYHVRAKY